MPSQPELVAALRAARPVAPAELRERTRFLAAQAPPPRRRITWRRTSLVLVPVALAAALAAALLPREDEKPTAAQTVPYAKSLAQTQAESAAAADSAAAPAPAPLRAAKVPAPSAGRAQRFQAELTLRVKDAAAVSSAAQQALRIATSLGGHPRRVQ